MPPARGWPLPSDSCMQCLDLLCAWTLNSFPVFLCTKSCDACSCVDALVASRRGECRPRTVRVSGSSL